MNNTVNALSRSNQLVNLTEKIDDNINNSEKYEFEYDINDIDQNFIQYINIESHNMNIIPENVSISTMSLTCSLGTPFNVANIWKYMILEHDNIVSIKTDKGIRRLNDLGTEFINSVNKNSDKNFSNQNTIIVQSRDDKYLNVKLFKNGSIQMTGCKDLVDANIVINKLVKKLKETLFIKKQDGNNLLTEVKFVKNINDLNVTKFKINLINTNFGISYYINKEELFTLLTSKGILCRITTNHACVNIKHKIINPENNIESLVSIFVFQTGNIIITGAKKAEEVRNAYNFIVNFLNQNKSKIMKKNIANVLTIEDLKEVLEDS